MNHKEIEQQDLFAPDFKPEIPEHLIADMSESQKWIYGQISIQSQQNHWLIARSIRSDQRQIETERQVTDLKTTVTALDELRKSLGAKWSVVAVIASLFLVPLAVSIAAEWFKVRVLGKP